MTVVDALRPRARQMMMDVPVARETNMGETLTIDQYHAEPSLGVTTAGRHHHADVHMIGRLIVETRIGEMRRDMHAQLEVVVIPHTTIMTGSGDVRQT